MIDRVHGRAPFERLARSGARVRGGVLWCTFVPDPHVSPPQVAFAIGRAVGPAVTRNRIRRRLRALLITAEGQPPAGLYLIGVTPAGAQRSFAELRQDLFTLMSRVRAHVPAG